MGWLTHKSGNQRNRSRNVLDAKLSTIQARRQRFRLFLGTSLASLTVFFLLYAGWRAGEWGLKRWVYENEAYAIQNLDIQTDGVIALEQIRRWAGVKRGDNLFRLELSRIKRDLELIPAIQSVAVERVPPRELRIHVQERVPVAQIVTTVGRGKEPAQSVVYLLDAEGYVMLPLVPRQRAVPLTAEEQYPVLLGASLAELTPGRRVESPQIRAAMRLIAAFEHSPMAGWVELRRVDVSSPEVLVVTTDQQSEVALRSQDLDRQLCRWRIISDTGAQQGRQIGSLDLSVPDNIPLRWMDTVPVPPSAPKARKPSLYKKKHV